MGDHQQMARVDVDADTWQAFRIEAIRRGRSIADWLGELVEGEVHATAYPQEAASSRDEAGASRVRNEGERRPLRPRPRSSMARTS